MNTSYSPDDCDEKPLMGLSMALQYALSGRIARKAWKDSRYWVQVFNGAFCLHKPTGFYHEWIMKPVDLRAGDWYVME